MTSSIVPRGRSTRIRGLQQHNRKVKEAIPGTRVAVNLIGVEKEAIIQRFLTAMPGRFETAKGDPRLAAAVVEVDPESGRARGIDRMLIAEKDVEKL